MVFIDFYYFLHEMMVANTHLDSMLFKSYITMDFFYTRTVLQKRFDNWRYVLPLGKFSDRFK